MTAYAAGVLTGVAGMTVLGLIAVASTALLIRAAHLHDQPDFDTHVDAALIFCETEDAEDFAAWEQQVRGTEDAS